MIRVYICTDLWNAYTNHALHELQDQDIMYIHVHVLVLPYMFNTVYKEFCECNTCSPTDGARNMSYTCMYMYVRIHM